MLLLIAQVSLVICVDGVWCWCFLLFWVGWTGQTVGLVERVGRLVGWDWSDNYHCPCLNLLKKFRDSFPFCLICSWEQFCENLNGRDICLLESDSLWLELVDDLKPNSPFLAFGRAKTAPKMEKDLRGLSKWEGVDSIQPEGNRGSARQRQSSQKRLLTRRQNLLWQRPLWVKSK